MTTKESKLELKEAVAEAKAAIRTFKREHGIKNVEAIEDEKILTEFGELQTNLEVAQELLDSFQAENKKGSGKVGGRLYSYGKILDPESGQERELTKDEEKKWRNHARKASKKADPPIDGASVPFDLDFFKPKVKKVKEKKEEPKDAPKADLGDTTVPEKTKKVKKVRQTTQEDED